MEIDDAARETLRSRQFYGSMALPGWRAMRHDSAIRHLAAMGYEEAEARNALALALDEAGGHIKRKISTPEVGRRHDRVFENWWVPREVLPWDPRFQNVRVG